MDRMIRMPNLYQLMYALSSDTLNYVEAIPWFYGKIESVNKCVRIGYDNDDIPHFRLWLFGP